MTTKTNIAIGAWSGSGARLSALVEAGNLHAGGLELPDELAAVANAATALELEAKAIAPGVPSRRAIELATGSERLRLEDLRRALRAKLDAGCEREARAERPDVGPRLVDDPAERGLEVAEDLRREPDGGVTDGAAGRLPGRSPLRSEPEERRRVHDLEGRGGSDVRMGGLELLEQANRRTSHEVVHATAAPTWRWRPVGEAITRLVAAAVAEPEAVGEPDALEDEADEAELAPA